MNDSQRWFIEQLTKATHERFTEMVYKNNLRNNSKKIAEKQVFGDFLVFLRQLNNPDSKCYKSRKTSTWKRMSLLSGTSGCHANTARGVMNH